MKRLVNSLPTYGQGLVEDLALYTNGLKQAVEEGDHNKTLRKLRMIWRELIGLNRMVSPDYQEHGNQDEVVITLFAGKSRLALPEGSS